MKQTANSSVGEVSTPANSRGESTGPAPCQRAAQGTEVSQRSDLVQEVVDCLRTEILAGQFGSNGPLPAEGKLSQSFGVSRTVVREAMRILRAQGLVEVSQGRRPRVRPADPQVVIDSLHALMQRSDASMLHLIEVRRPLETEIAEVAARRATAPQIEAMEAAIRQQAVARTLNGRVEADVRFHDLLAETTGNPVFQLLLATLAGPLRESRRETIARTGNERALSGHRAVLAAVRRQDAPGARAAMLEHLTMAEMDLRGKGKLAGVSR